MRKTNGLKFAKTACWMQWHVMCSVVSNGRCYKLMTRKCGNAQHDGRPLGGSFSPPIECYWLVNASPLNCGRWEGQNSGPIFSRSWTKVPQIKFACVRMSVVCNAVFRLTMSCCIREIFAIWSQNRAKIWCFWAAKFRRKAANQISDQVL